MSDLAPGAMKAAERDGRRVLLVRLGDRIHAVDADCPHAGAPLEEGVLCRGRITCPWHKARFAAETGALIDGPAVDALRSYPVRIEAGKIVVTLPDDVPPLSPTPPESARTEGPVFAVVGAGAAGTAAAQALREYGFAGRIVLISREDRLPYDRTIQSKYVLSGDLAKAGEKSPLHRQDFYDRLGIERRIDAVVRLDAERQRIDFASGETLVYDRALLATGGRPKPLEAPGADLANVFTLRSAADAAAIVAVAEKATRAVVVGGSFIGLEVAASLRQRGLEVILIAPDRVPLGKLLGPEVGNAVRRLHEKHGTRLALGAKLARLEGRSTVEAAILESGERIAADLVVAGIGVRPETAFLQGVGTDPDGGIPVDGSLLAAPGLYVAGDVAAFPLDGSGASTRIEHWRLAQQQGRFAARTMMHPEERAVFDAVPYFWTIQFDERLDYVGHAGTWDEVVVDGDLEKPEFVAYYLRAGRIAAAAGWHRDADMAALTELLALRRDLTVGEIAAGGGSPTAYLASLG